MPEHATAPSAVSSDAAGIVDGSAPPALQAYAKLPAQNVHRARAFYRSALGLNPCGEHDRHLHYELDGAYFIVFPSTGLPSGTHDQLGFVVGDIEQVVARLRANGVSFENPAAPPGATQRDGITDFGAVRAAWFKDSEGNLISLAEFAGGTPFKRAQD